MRYQLGGNDFCWGVCCVMVFGSNGCHPRWRGPVIFVHI